VKCFVHWQVVGLSLAGFVWDALVSENTFGANHVDFDRSVPCVASQKTLLVQACSDNLLARFAELWAAMFLGTFAVVCRAMYNLFDEEADSTTGKALSISGLVLQAICIVSWNLSVLTP
jgi:hypothetical protein